MTLAKLLAREVVAYLEKWYPCKPEYRYEYAGDEGQVAVAVYPVVPEGTDLMSDAAWPAALKWLRHEPKITLRTDVSELVKQLATEFIGMGGVWTCIDPNG